MWQGCIVVFHLLRPSLPSFTERVIPSYDKTHKNIQLWLFSRTKYLLSTLLLIEVVCVVKSNVGFQGGVFVLGIVKVRHPFYHIVVTGCQLEHCYASWAVVSKRLVIF